MDIAQPISMLRVLVGYALLDRPPAGEVPGHAAEWVTLGVEDQDVLELAGLSRSAPEWEIERLSSRILHGAVGLDVDRVGVPYRRALLELVLRMILLDPEHLDLLAEVFRALRLRYWEDPHIDEHVDAAGLLTGGLDEDWAEQVPGLVREAVLAVFANSPDFRP